jgi:hypothetical protein
MVRPSHTVQSVSEPATGPKVEETEEDIPPDTFYHCEGKRDANNEMRENLHLLVGRRTLRPRSSLFKRTKQFVLLSSG